MTNTRRRVLRPNRPVMLAPLQLRNVERRTTRLKAKKAGLVRWMSKLRRAFNAVQRLQQQIARLERQLGQPGKK